MNKDQIKIGVDHISSRLAKKFNTNKNIFSSVPSFENLIRILQDEFNFPFKQAIRDRSSDNARALGNDNRIYCLSAILSDLNNRQLAPENMPSQLLEEINKDFAVYIRFTYDKKRILILGKLLDVLNCADNFDTYRMINLHLDNTYYSVDSDTGAIPKSLKFSEYL